MAALDNQGASSTVLPDLHKDRDHEISVSAEDHEQEINPQSEESVVRHQDIEAVKNLIGASSRVFFKHIRDAAARRVADVVRFRDTVVAKERENREAIATAEAILCDQSKQVESSCENNVRTTETSSFKARPVPESSKSSGTWGVPFIKTRPSTVPRSPLIGKRGHSTTSKNGQERRPLQNLNQNSFKAKPLPKTTGKDGHWGTMGLPMVKKRPTTIPISPPLGMKRPPSQQHSAPEQSSFKARPLPKTTGESGSSGAMGLPFVPKRKVTVPVSPLLGMRRPKVPQTDPQKASTNETSMALSSSSKIRGEDLLDSTYSSPVPQMTTPQANPKGEEFIPRSTLRARKRAEFDTSRRLNEVEREREERLQVRLKLKALDKDLLNLRGQI